MTRRVVQLNVRHGRGGAAQIARTLTAGASRRGWHADFCYGYGPGGRPEPAVASNVYATTNRLRATANFCGHHAIGRDLVGLSRSGLHRIESIVEAADVVHMHAVHSYWLDFEQLVGVLTRHPTPVVWTMHDHWAVTGRCAQPGSCTRWIDGCGLCPNRQAYPPARYDNTGSELRRKRALIERIDALEIVACAPWLAEQISTHWAGMTVRTISNGTDFADVAVPREVTSDDRRTRLVVTGVDLSDGAKIDHDLLRELASRDAFELTTVGDNSPLKTVNNVDNLGRLAHRDLARIYAKADALIYTSRIDYHPLTIVEALAARLPVIAYASSASNGILHPLGIDTYHDLTHVLETVLDPKSLASVLEHQQQVLGSYVTRTGSDMCDDYYRLYDKMAV